MTMNNQNSHALDRPEQGTTIWTFWEGPLDEVVLRCLESIRMQNPNRPVVVLNNATLYQYLDESDFPSFNGRPGRPEDFEKVQYLADWIRITLLYKYGGIWFDASCIATNSVESWMNPESDKITMFPMHVNQNIHGNWAMAVPQAGHPLLKAWRAEMAHVLINNSTPHQPPLKYCADAFLQYPDLHQLWYNPAPPPLPYLWVYLVLQVVLQEDPSLHQTICLLPSIDGPMYRRYLCNVIEGETDQLQLSQNTANHLATKPFEPTTHDRYFIKLVGKDRAPVARHLQEMTFQPHSALADFVQRVPARPIVVGQNLQLLLATRRVRRRSNNHRISFAERESASFRGTSIATV